MNIARLSDCHTHDAESVTGIISLQPHELDKITPGHLYSVGVHPWNAAEATDEDWRRVEEAARRDDVVMIGEAGLDALCATPREVQEEAFRRMIDISEAVGKPLVIHSVRTVHTIIHLHRRLRPTQPWIIHGFRGKPELAAQLVREGFYISLGEHYNPAVLAVIPPDRILTESDEAQSAPSIASLYDYPVKNLHRLTGRAYD